MSGSVGAGKTTLAAGVAARSGAVHLASDALRGSHGHPFLRMTRAMESALADGRRVVLDSTGMSFRFRALVETIRDRAYHVHLRVDVLEWQRRERGRTDRPPLDASVYRDSSAIVYPTPPDLTLDTTRLTPEDAVEIALRAWEASR